MLPCLQCSISGITISISSSTPNFSRYGSPAGPIASILLIRSVNANDSQFQAQSRTKLSTVTCHSPTSSRTASASASTTTVTVQIPGVTTGSLSVASGFTASSYYNIT